MKYLLHRIKTNDAAKEDGSCGEPASCKSNSSNEGDREHHRMKAAMMNKDLAWTVFEYQYAKFSK